METSKNGIDLIKKFEGCRLQAYKPTPDDVWTIGYGHTKNVKQGDNITQLQAETLLMSDLQIFEKEINKLNLNLTQNQFDAIICFVFNVGVAKFKKSTMLKFLEAGHYPLAAGQFDRWVYQGKQKLSGLVKRRKAEKELFLS